MRRAPTSGRERALAQNRTAKSIGDDQPRLFRDEFARKLLGDAEEETIAILDVVGPFRVARIIGLARFGLDDPDLARRRDRHHVGAAAVGEQNFQDRREPVIAQHARDAARKQRGGVWA